MTTPPPPPKTEQTLDRHGLLSAVSALCASNRGAASLLWIAAKQLTAHPKNWQKIARRLNNRGISAHYAAAPLRAALNLPGDLALLQLSEQSFILLLHRDQRWQIIDHDGAALPDEVNTDSTLFVEVVALRMPITPFEPGGLSSLAAVWPELRNVWAELGVTGFLINSGQLLLPLFSMLVYDKIAQNGLFETLWGLALGMILYIAIDAAMRLIRSWTTERIGSSLTLRSDETLWHTLLSQTDTPEGGFARFLTNYRDLAMSRDFVYSSYLLAVADIPFLLLYLTVVGMVAWPLLIVALVMILIYGVAGLMLQGRLTTITWEAERSTTRKMAFMSELLGSLDVARTTPGSKTLLRFWRDLADHSAHVNGRRQLAQSQLSVLSGIMQIASTVAMLVAGVYLINERVLSTGQLIACNILTSRGMGLVASLFTVTGKWKDFQRAATRVESSLEPVKEQECSPRPVITGQITVIGLSKKYEGRPPALENVSFSVAPGERIALLGRPGAGKTTLLRCLAGLCHQGAGQILIDGLALQDISRFDRIRWMAYKSQSPNAFAGTLDTNLRIAGDRDNNRVALAIWAAGLEEEFSSGRMSLGMHLNERGSNLSGGQLQKVALARAFAQPSRILLLDEPTLGLDPECERMLAERLPKLLDDTSLLIMTTHSSIMLDTAQRIIALDGGRIVADGARDKLIIKG